MELKLDQGMILRRLLAGDCLVLDATSLGIV
jgi:hypothetical protein